VVELFLDKEAVDINLQDNSGYTAISLAIYFRNIAAAKLLTARDDIDLKSSGMMDGPANLCMRGQLHSQWYLDFSGEATINARDNDGYTPLAIACHLDNVHIVYLLLCHRNYRSEPR